MGLRSASDTKKFAGRWGRSEFSGKVINPIVAGTGYVPREPLKAKFIPDTGTARKRMQYTGDKMIGIGTMHKSNAVPVFSEESAQDISRMRRG